MHTVYFICYSDDVVFNLSLYNSTIQAVSMLFILCIQFVTSTVIIIIYIINKLSCLKQKKLQSNAYALNCNFISYYISAAAIQSSSLPSAFSMSSSKAPHNSG